MGRSVGWRVLYRGPAFAAVLGVGVLGSLAIGLAKRDAFARQRTRAWWLHRVSPWLLRATGYRCTTLREDSGGTTNAFQAGLTVSNHISYVDVLLIATQFPVVFVTSTEVRDSAGLGQLTALAGCCYVDRRSARALRGEIAMLAQLMRDGLHVVIFPEATATRGDRVLPFKAALFESVRQSGRPLSVVRVDYPSDQRRSASYAGSDRFGPHLFGLLASSGHSPTVTWLAHDPRPEERDARELARWAWGVVAGVPLESASGD